MSPINSNTLNKRELIRIDFLSQEVLDHVPVDSKISPFFPVICGKNAENLTGLSCGIDLRL
ncbi:MAG TPA: hypothetical protein VIH61_00165, partial [Waddliaceae bacterium]